MTNSGSQTVSAVRLAIIPAIFILAFGLAVSAADGLGIVCSVVGLVIWVIAEISISRVEDRHPAHLGFVRSALHVLSGAMAILAISALFLANQESFANALPKRMMGITDEITRSTTSGNVTARISIPSVQFGVYQDTKDIVGTLVSNQFTFVDMRQIIDRISERALVYTSGLAEAIAILMMIVGVFVVAIVWVASGIVWPLLDKISPDPPKQTGL